MRLLPIGGILHSTGRPTCALLLCVLLTQTSLSQTQQAAPQQPATSAASNKFVLDDGTPIKLRLNRNLSSADAKTGDNIDFEVLEEVKVNDIVVIAKGNLAIGTITDAEHKKRMARGGKLDIEIDYVKLADGEKAALKGGEGNQGRRAYRGDDRWDRSHELSILAGGAVLSFHARQRHHNPQGY